MSHAGGKEYWLQVNTNKNNVMVYRRKTNKTTKMNILECALEFDYLGRIIILL